MYYFFSIRYFLACLGLFATIGLMGAPNTAAETLAGSEVPSESNPILKSKISKVTVFSDRALITRRATMELSSGDHRLVFNKLPGDLDVNSVQVKGKGNGIIKSVKIQSQAVAGAVDEDLRRLQQQKNGIENKLNANQDALAQAKKEKEFVEAIAKRLTAATDKSEQAELNPEKWIEMVAFYRRKLAALDQEIREISNQTPALREEQARIDQEILVIQRNQTAKQRVEVWVEMSEAGLITLDLDYIVFGPQWYARYDIRADSKQGTVQIAYRAMIIQNSSEDWENVDMTLSTAQPQAGGQHPDLVPWRVTVYQEAPKPSYKQQSRGRMTQMYNQMPMAAPAAAAAVQAEEQAMPDLDVSQASVDTGATAVVFNLKGPQSVHSDNQPQEVTVLVHEFPAVFRYSTAPKLAARAYLKAKIKNSTDYPMLPGQTSLFLDNNFVANGNLELVSPNEEFWAFLGADDGIKVEYKLINRKEEAEGVFGGRTRIAFEYLIKITNNKKQAREVVVWDQIPLSGNSEIQVDLVEPPYKADSENLKKNPENIMEWLYELESGKTVTVPLKFNVTYPKGMRVQGL